MYKNLSLLDCELLKGQKKGHIHLGLHDSVSSLYLFLWELRFIEEYSSLIRCSIKVSYYSSPKNVLFEHG